MKDDPLSLIPDPPLTFPPEISKQWRRIRKQTIRLIERSERRRQDMVTSLRLIDLIEKDIKKFLRSQKDQIISLSDQLKLQYPDPESERQIEQHKQILLQLLEDNCKEKIDRMIPQRKQLEEDVECINSITNFTRSLMKNATDLQFVSHLPLITDQLFRFLEREGFSKPFYIDITHFEMVDEEKDSINTDLSDRLKGIRLIEKQSEDSERKLRLTQLKGMSGRPTIVFGSEGSEEGQFSAPKNVVVDRDNNIIVCDTDNRRIQIFNEYGQFLQSEKFKGVKEGRNERIIAASIDVDGNIVMFGFDSHQIIIFDPISRGIIRRFGDWGSEDGQFNKPESIRVDYLNRIIVCDTANDRIQMFDHQGNHLLSFGSKGSEDGQFNTPFGVTIDRLNFIIVCDTLNHRIQVFDEKGIHLLSFGSKGSGNGQLNRPTRVAVDHHNNIIVSDWGNNRIQVFGPQGKWISSFGFAGKAKGQFWGPQGITVDHSNRIIVSDWGNHRVQIF